jgi:hypothetical protein
MEETIESVAVAEMALELVRQVAQLDGNAKVKVAALRAAAGVIEQAIFAAGIATIVAQSLTPKN